MRALIEDHRASVREFIGAAQAASAEGWNASPRADKWSPAQVAEHLRLTYELLVRELRGGQGVRVRLKWWRRAMLRATVLPRILRGGRMPAGVPAVRELRPGEGPFERQVTLDQLVILADEFVRELETRGDARLSHPFFGRLGRVAGLGVLAAHNRHHQRQLPTA